MSARLIEYLVIGFYLAFINLFGFAMFLTARLISKKKNVSRGDTQ